LGWEKRGRKISRVQLGLLVPHGVSKGGVSHADEGDTKTLRGDPTKVRESRAVLSIRTTIQKGLGK